MSIQIVTHFLFGDLSFNSWVLMVLCIFWTMNPCQIFDFHIYSSTLWFVFSLSWHYSLKHISFNLVAAKWSNFFPFLLILLLMLLVSYFKINWLIQGEKYVSILKKKCLVVTFRFLVYVELLLYMMWNRTSRYFTYGYPIVP